MNYALTNFQGPLDLLLHLISKAKIEPEEIFVSEITAQYIAYTRDIKPADMETASSFLQMAATLVYIKSRALLPGRRLDDDLDEDGLTPEEQLIYRLKVYRAFKQAAYALTQNKESVQGRYFKLPEEMIAPAFAEIQLSGDAELLRKAFLKLYSIVLREEMFAKKETRIRPAMFHVKGQIEMILAKLTIMPQIAFYDLFRASPSREEVVTTFMALLELLNEGRIKVKQKDLFGDIMIHKNK